MSWCYQYLKRNRIFAAYGITYLIQLEDLRIGLCQSTSVDFLEVFSQIDVKGTGKVYPIDLIKFLSVHRLAIS